jgi:hypothetical protein
MVSDRFQTLLGALTALCTLSGKEAELKHVRFGNQKLQSELGERKLIFPKESVTK